MIGRTVVPDVGRNRQGDQLAKAGRLRPSALFASALASQQERLLRRGLAEDEGMLQYSENNEAYHSVHPTPLRLMRRTFSLPTPDRNRTENFSFNKAPPPPPAGPAVFLVAGHGVETIGHRQIVPRGCTLVTFASPGQLLWGHWADELEYLFRQSNPRLANPLQFAANLQAQLRRADSPQWIKAESPSVPRVHVFPEFSTMPMIQCTLKTDHFGGTVLGLSGVLAMGKLPSEQPLFLAGNLGLSTTNAGLRAAQVEDASRGAVMRPDGRLHSMWEIMRHCGPGVYYLAACRASDAAIALNDFRAGKPLLNYVEKQPRAATGWEKAYVSALRRGRLAGLARRTPRTEEHGVHIGLAGLAAAQAAIPAAMRTPAQQADLEAARAEILQRYAYINLERKASENQQAEIFAEAGFLQPVP